MTDQKLGQIYNEEGILLIFNKEFWRETDLLFLNLNMQ
jgi:CMP-N-acetylneuraminic acid synthetase